jgi:hypothetical protein
MAPVISVNTVTKVNPRLSPEFSIAPPIFLVY